MDQFVPPPVLLRDGTLPSSCATRTGPRPGTAFGVAIAHAAIIVTVATVLPRTAPAPKPDIMVPIAFEPVAPAAAPPSPQNLAASVLPVPTASVSDALSPILPLNVPADTHLPPGRVFRNRVTASHTKSVQQASAAAATPTQTPGLPGPMPRQQPQQQPAASRQASSVALQTWESRVHRAVQDALIYPNAARLMRREGRTRIRFDYDHTAVTSVSVVQSSGLPALDQAALGAVTHAAIPPLPPELSGQRRSLILWVDFLLTAEE